MPAVASLTALNERLLESIRADLTERTRGRPAPKGDLLTEDQAAFLPLIKQPSTRHGNTSADPLPRDECIRQIRRNGRKVWKQSIGYHRRSLAETAVHRLKSSFGGSLENRNIENQKTEISLDCKLFNQFVTLGMPALLYR